MFVKSFNISKCSINVLLFLFSNLRLFEFKHCFSNLLCSNNLRCCLILTVQENNKYWKLSEDYIALDYIVVQFGRPNESHKSFLIILSIIISLFEVLSSPFVILFFLMIFFFFLIFQVTTVGMTTNWNNNSQVLPKYKCFDLFFSFVSKPN